MRALYIHADYMEFEAKQKTPVAEEIPDAMHNGRMEEVLVAFITVEKEDEDHLSAVMAEAVEDLIETFKRVDAQRIMLYPYAHLSNQLASPRAGTEALKTMESSLIAAGIETVRAPFGWYKAFTISCKGHPLSELSRDFKGQEKQELVTGEESFLVLTPNGEEFDVREFKGGSACFREMLDKEALKIDKPAHKGEPDYLRLCKKFGIQWEPMSDVGHMCFTPHGALMFDLISDYSTDIVNSLDLPIYMVKGTNMFSLDEPPVREHAELFGDRLYTIKTEKKSFIMRYAACHQQFAMMKNWNMSYRQLPLGAFEVADSYRLEQSGETMLCFRTRRLNMPDLHVLCRNEDEAREKLEMLDARIYQEVEDLGRDYEMLINISSRKAYEENKDMILNLLRVHDKPAILHFYPEGINYYWTVNIEYHLLDQMKRAREIGTVQIDVGNAQRFDITYADEKAEDQHPVILHCAVIGTIERYLYTLLDTAVGIEKSGRPGYLPTWIVPEQVRLLPVSQEHVSKAVEMADALESMGVRVCIDDSDGTVGKKVRKAKQDWCSYVSVLGDQESASGLLKVYVRSENTDIEMTAEQLGKRVKEETVGKPFRKLYMPRMLSRRVDL